MAFVLKDSTCFEHEISSPAEAAQLFTDLARGRETFGPCRRPIWCGPRPGSEDLRVDVNADDGYAAVCWLPDGTYAVEREPGRFFASISDDGIDLIPGALARVGLGEARRAVVEYFTTGRRPAFPRWATEEELWPIPPGDAPVLGLLDPRLPDDLARRARNLVSPDPDVRAIAEYWWTPARMPPRADGIRWILPYLLAAALDPEVPGRAGILRVLAATSALEPSEARQLIGLLAGPDPEIRAEDPAVRSAVLDVLGPHAAADPVIAERFTTIVSGAGDPLYRLEVLVNSRGVVPLGIAVNLLRIIYAAAEPTPPFPGPPADSLMSSLWEVEQRQRSGRRAPQVIDLLGKLEATPPTGPAPMRALAATLLRETGWEPRHDAIILASTLFRTWRYPFEDLVALVRDQTADPEPLLREAAARLLSDLEPRAAVPGTDVGSQVSVDGGDTWFPWRPVLDAVARWRITGDAAPAIDAFRDMWERAHSAVSKAEILRDATPLGPDAAPLVPLVQAELDSPRRAITLIFQDLRLIDACRAFLAAVQPSAPSTTRWDSSG